MSSCNLPQNNVYPSQDRISLTQNMIEKSIKDAQAETEQKLNELEGVTHKIKLKHLEIDESCEKIKVASEKIKLDLEEIQKDQEHIEKDYKLTIQRRKGIDPELDDLEKKMKHLKNSCESNDKAIAELKKKVNRIYSPKITGAQELETGSKSKIILIIALISSIALTLLGLIIFRICSVKEWPKINFDSSFNT